ncbi:PREDICTED: nuclear pore complex protein Nup107-like [Branchiostoma belcheri]|uniref:Nuclear pore complex protein n=1 Tax=Branchiostoma belcheri TaxID=7741 RepID=A0A6P4YB38_BRABE|nr:PREDICTED: nuclear pore complex protein Nup107-like [Branchiostoma belcheri]
MAAAGKDFQSGRKPPGDRLSASFSDAADSTIGVIWQMSQEGAEFNPSAMNEALDQRRQLRKNLRPSFPTAALAASPAVRQEAASRTLRRRSTNVEKSLQLLDQAVGGTPGPVLRMARTPGSQLRHASYTPRPVPSTSQFDVSMSLGMTPAKSMPLSQSMVHTPAQRPPSTMEMYTPGGMTEDITSTNMSLLLEEDPGLAASSGVYTEFMQRLRARPTSKEVFELLDEYQQVCCEQVSLLKRIVKKVTTAQNKFQLTLTVLQLLQQEKCTWRLLFSMYKDRIQSEFSESEAMMTDLVNNNVSERKIVEALFEREASTRQSQLVIDWLERNAADDVVDFYEKVEFYSQSVCWENTLHTLQQGSGLTHGSRALVTEMDPDAPIRQQRPLADLDKEDEVRLLKYIFTYLRAGQLEEAQRLCRKCGQSWRAATLEGWRLHHDPNMGGGSSELSPIEGNPNRDVWKAVCWRMAQDEHVHLYERAVYAALSGNLKELLPACESWEDWLWAYYKVMVDSRVEQEIRTVRGDRPMEPLPPAYWDRVLTPEAIFKELQSSPHEGVQSEAEEPFHIIQKYIILGDVDGLIETMSEWIKADSPPHQHLVRFMAHLVLFFRSIGVHTKDELCTAILEHYVRTLMEAGETQLVAFYTATLPLDRQVLLYAHFLERVEEHSQRQMCLELAEEAGLDIPTITKTVVENIRTHDQGDFKVSAEVTAALEAATSEEDRRKIRAIDWLVFDESQRAEALKQSNAVMRTFLAMKKHAAAKEVFEKIPSGSVDVINRQWQIQNGSAPLPAEDDNAIREYICIQTFLMAHDAFNDWFTHFHHNKPHRPKLQEGANFTEKVKHEHREQEYEVEVSRWHHSLSLQTDDVVSKIYNVLLFPDGWMVDQRMESDEDEGRTHQLDLLRQLCLPTMALLLHTVLHETRRYADCMVLADIIASEQHQLYTVFRRDELQRFLQKLRDSSIQLLDQNLDPLGYQVSS